MTRIINLDEFKSKYRDPATYCRDTVSDWEDPKANRLAFSESIQRFIKEKEDVDLIVLPEVFTTGFSMNLDSIDSWKSGETLDWMRDLAKKYNVAITGSVAFRFEDGIARNR
ncbi:MAG: hypothetical protein O3A35_06825, partial [Bacteroidetes bacterium]|nr:hypothetical protein [Bacteroidota bacterium]